MRHREMYFMLDLMRDQYIKKKQPWRSNPNPIIVKRSGRAIKLTQSSFVCSWLA